MKNKFYSGQLFPFFISLCIFVIAAVFGWLKLRYGFNFTDEGWAMTEAWRIAAGDDFFRDKILGALRMAPLINTPIFKYYPGITLLGFRKLQFFLTIISLLFLSFSLYKISKEFWYSPIIFSLFAFTGLDPTGMMSNLSYFTYTHLFITLHLAFLIMGLIQQSILWKRILFIIAGIFLWLISFSLLHMSLSFLSAILLFLIFKKYKIGFPNFNLKDLYFIIAPFLLFWTIFFCIYGNLFIRQIITEAYGFLITTTHQPGYLLSINWDISKRIIIILPFIVTFLFSTKISKKVPLICVLSILAVLMYEIIDTSLFGLIKPFYRGWYNSWAGRPLWFAALMISLYFLLLCYFILKVFKKDSWNNYELSGFVFFIYGIISAANANFFSALGAIVVLYSSIPAIAATTCIILSIETIKKRLYLVQLVILFLFFAPFYYTTAWSDWKFTFFDVAPEEANAEIENGFGRDIKTNQIYKNLYDWISTTAKIYSKKDDYIISYVNSPMVYMIARRRPALEISHIDFNELSHDHPNTAIDLLSFLHLKNLPENWNPYDLGIELMKRRGRRPQMVYVFEAVPVLVPVTLGKSEYLWQAKQFSFSSDDPISRYVLNNMTLVDSFTISKEFSLQVRCFIDNSSAVTALKK
ncbi:MAG: hypothetical protein JW976_05345 [Syntrophaceae bacterium]|nr:hypothetical protein [Syntrophaceae bacterium]